MLWLTLLTRPSKDGPPQQIEEDGEGFAEKGDKEEEEEDEREKEEKGGNDEDKHGNYDMLLFCFD